MITFKQFIADPTILGTPDELHRLTEEEKLLVEGVISSISSGLQAMKNYFTNMSSAVSTASSLKANDGKRGFEQTPIADSAKKMRSDCAELYKNTSPKVQKTIDLFLKKTSAAKLTGPYLSRNYFKDFTVYYLVHSILSVTKNQAKEKGLELIIDKLVGFALTVITGIPSIDDIRDFADMAKSAVKISNNLATKINQLQNV